ncbi:MAG TPA: hypothetical protein VHR66_24850 [Gemmataceae bacterium]|jgi:hypothetical protein|nr:hypothetical protein [Gemmataceae bacterium]
MSTQKLVIETTVKLDDRVLTTPALSRTITVDSACDTTVTVPKNAPGCKKCFRVEGGLQKLLKFLLLKPVPQPIEGKDEKPEVILNKGFKFYTSDPNGDNKEKNNGEPVDLTDTLIYTDGQIDLLFGANQKELEKITFLNHTDHDVDVRIILGRDLTPCDEDDAEEPAYGAKVK